MSSMHLEHLGTGKPSSPAEVESSRDFASSEKQQAKGGPEAPTATSQRLALPSAQPARAVTARPSNAAYGPSTTPSSKLPEGLPATEAMVPVAPLQRISHASKILGRNLTTIDHFDRPTLPPKTSNPAYQNNPMYGPCLAWDGGASRERGGNAYSHKPGAEFDVMRRRP